jgi:hypothetical protein
MPIPFKKANAILVMGKQREHYFRRPECRGTKYERFFTHCALYMNFKCAFWCTHCTYIYFFLYNNIQYNSYMPDVDPLLSNVSVNNARC